MTARRTVMYGAMARTVIIAQGTSRVGEATCRVGTTNVAAMMMCAGLGGCHSSCS